MHYGGELDTGIKIFTRDKFKCHICAKCEHEEEHKEHTGYIRDRVVTMDECYIIYEDRVME